LFKAVTSDSKLLKDSIDTISQLIDDGLFKIKKDGIELSAADRATVSFVDFKIKSSAFDEYECDADVNIGLNLLNFLTVLKRANANDKLTLSLNDKENRLEIFLEGDSKRKFAIPLIEIRREEMPQVEKLDFAAQADVRADIIEQGLSDAEIVADSITIELSEDSLSMFASGNSSKSEMNIEKGNEALLELNAGSAVQSRYSLDYLKKMIKGSRISDKMKLMLGKDFPLKIVFEGDDVYLSMILAPRVSED
jgi:proliferating cell nuclear antigen